MKNRIKFASVLLGLNALLGAHASNAATINFEDLVSPTSGTSAPLASGGFVFSATDMHGVNDIANFGASNGTHYLVYRSTGAGTESFAASSGTAFNLSSLDLGGWWNFGATPLSIDITGLRTNGSSVSSTVVVQPASFQSYALTGFTNLKSVTFGGFPLGWVAVDNIHVTPVPEPDSVVMLLGGLALLAGWTGRRKAAAQPKM